VQRRVKLPKNRLKKRNSLDLLVLALGNPGTRYHATRHNAGFQVADTIAGLRQKRFRKPLLKSYVACRIREAASELFLVKPLTYMNNSGLAARQVLRACRMDTKNMLVVCDNLDLSPGTCRLKRGGGDAGHNGLKSIIDHTGKNDFLRLYLGIGRPGRQNAVVDWVLGEPESADRELMQQAVRRAAEAVQSLLFQEIEQVMNELNRKP